MMVSPSGPPNMDLCISSAWLPIMTSSSVSVGIFQNAKEQTGAKVPITGNQQTRPASPNIAQFSKERTGEEGEDASDAFGHAHDDVCLASVPLEKQGGQYRASEGQGKEFEEEYRQYCQVRTG
mmetsp:Transcript_23603/g.49949  ORF Transcript_23603/g.49949 Transcript_23603/m.49949 type:complete len:123 (-) Transcript_23603:353-721(-)